MLVVWAVAPVAQPFVERGWFVYTLATQAPAVHIWIAQGKAPTFLKFEGALYLDGPTWCIELSAPRWKE